MVQRQTDFLTFICLSLSFLTYTVGMTMTAPNMYSFVRIEWYVSKMWEALKIMSSTETA